MIVNEWKYPWLAAAAIVGGKGVETFDGGDPARNQQHRLDNSPTSSEIGTIAGNQWSEEGEKAILHARAELQNHGAVAFPEFLTPSAISKAVAEMAQKEDDAFTTVTEHTPYLTDIDTTLHPENSIYNHVTPTVVASTAYDELSEDSVLRQLYHDPRLLKMVSAIVSADDPFPKSTHEQQQQKRDQEQRLYLSEDPLGCCSVNVFRPGYYHGFHYDESEFSVTLMLQDAEDTTSGLFQYTDPIRQTHNRGLSLELEKTADVFRDFEHPEHTNQHPASDTPVFAEHESLSSHVEQDPSHHPKLHTLDFRPGTLLVLAGSKSLHRVTEVRGNRSRWVAVLTFASQPGFCNTPKVQEMFWGRTVVTATT